MKDQKLADLNFLDLLHYGGRPRTVEHRYKPRLPCSGYCTSCESSGLSILSGHSLDRMSHGCDTADFVETLGPMPTSEPSILRPVLFLLEDPGGEKGNGEKVCHQGLQKSPPVRHYYWSPDPRLNGWPTSTQSLPDFYGSYFAYLMRRHGLRDVYITNSRKCGFRSGPNVDKSWKDAVSSKCGERHLLRELNLFKPELALCFGRAAEGRMNAMLEAYSLRKIPVVYLFHPRMLEQYWLLNKTRGEAVEENDTRIHQALEVLED